MSVFGKILALFPKKQRPVSMDECFVVFDFETSGLNPSKDEILSFAFLKIKQRSILIEERFEGFLLNKSNRVKSAEIHHITKEDLNKGYSEMQFLDKAESFIKDCVLLGHHVDFDAACLERLMLKYNHDKLTNPRVDTARLAARLAHPLMSEYGGQKALKSLDTLCKQYGISPEARHSAGGDTLTTAFLFLKLLKEAEKRGIKTI